MILLFHPHPLVYLNNAFFNHQDVPYSKYKKLAAGNPILSHREYLRVKLDYKRKSRVNFVYKTI